MPRGTRRVKRVEPVVLFSNPFPARHDSAARHKFFRFPQDGEMLGER